MSLLTTRRFKLGLIKKKVDFFFFISIFFKTNYISMHTFTLALYFPKEFLGKEKGYGVCMFFFLHWVWWRCHLQEIKIIAAFSSDLLPREVNLPRRLCLATTQDDIFGKRVTNRIFLFYALRRKVSQTIPE